MALGGSEDTDTLTQDPEHRLPELVAHLLRAGDRSVRGAHTLLKSKVNMGQVRSCRCTYPSPVRAQP